MNDEQITHENIQTGNPKLERMETNLQEHNQGITKGNITTANWDNWKGDKYFTNLPLDEHN